jgi:hypothetical protein
VLGRTVSLSACMVQRPARCVKHRARPAEYNATDKPAVVSPTDSVELVELDNPAHRFAAPSPKRARVMTATLEMAEVGPQVSGGHVLDCLQLGPRLEGANVVG